MLNVVIGVTCVVIVLKILFDEHYRQQNQARMQKFTDLLDKVLPKAFPQFYQDPEVASEEPTAETGGVVFTDMSAGRMPPELEEMLFGDKDKMAELELRAQLRQYTVAVMKGHNFQISFEEAEKKAIELVQRLDSQARAPLASEIEALLPKTEVVSEEVPSIPNV